MCAGVVVRERVQLQVCVNRSVSSYVTQDVPVDAVLAAEVPQSDGAV